MSRYPGRILSSTAPTVNANTAKGIWTLDEALRYSRAGQWPVPTGGGDPYFQYNTMLLPGQGTTGMQNHSFLDSSSNNFTINRSGNTTQGTFTPFSQASGYWGMYNSGSSYLSIADNAAFNLSGTPFTIEAWVYHVADSGAYTNWVVGKRGTGSPFTSVWALSISSTNFVEFGTTGYTWGITSSFPIQRNTWNHIAGTYDGTSVRLYVNGVLAAGPTAATVSDVGAAVTIGNYTVGANPVFTGHISNLRIVKGTAVYTSNFTPSTTPLTAISGTSLLTCQSNRFVDNSTNAFAITVNSTPQITPFQPFGAPTVAYSASTIGGSGYFDGTSDYLTATANNAFNFGTGDFTVEGWIYPVAAGTMGIWANGPASAGSFGIAINSSGRLQMDYYGGTSLAGATNVPVNAWSYFAFVRTGSTLNIYLNGVRDATTTTSSNNSTNDFALGLGWTNITTGGTNGYISGFRISDAFARYTGTTMTVPTAPTVNDGNTTVLCNFTNAGIIDNAQDNVLETVGDAKISTTQYKWGASSMYFDGNGDNLRGPSTPALNCGTGDFTIEGWIYVSSRTLNYPLIFGNNNGSYTAGALALVNSSANNAAYNDKFCLNAYDINSSGAPALVSSSTNALNTWYHLALVRVGTTLKMFVNGNQTASATISASVVFNWGKGGVFVGGGNWDTTNSYFNGYINDLRLTNGYARYPYNFTAPTAALPLFYQAAGTPSADPYFENTTLLLPGNGTNGAQNNTFLDSSGNGNHPSRSGNVTQGTFTPFSQTGWSNYFATTNASIAYNAAICDFGTGSFTIELWVYPSSVTNIPILSTYNYTGGGEFGWNFSTNASGLLYFAAWAPGGGSPQSITSGVPLLANTWSHIAFSRDGSSAKLFLNGQVVASSSGFTQNIVSTMPFTFGGVRLNGGIDPAFAYTGYMSNVRVVKGSAVYTAPFTPATTPLTAIANTTLLTCQDNRFKDNSTNNFTLSPTTLVSVQAFSPFNPTVSYSTSTVGGSGYFDGSADYLDASKSAFVATGDFTLEAWYYQINQTSGFQGIVSASVSGGSTGFRITTDNGTLTFWLNGSSIASTSGPQNQWNHIVLVRSGSGSNNVSCYVNGTRIGQGTNTSSTTNSSLTVGRYYTDLANYYLNGYVSSLRLVVGSALYSGATISVPTAPLTAVTNTQLLLSGTNGGITDATAKNNLETVGGASISTAVSKFGGSSMYFDGSGDYLDARLGPVQVLGGDFTVEMWVNPSTITGSNRTFLFLENGSNSAAFFMYGATGYVGLDINNVATYNLGSTAITTNSWQHLAFVRYGSTLTAYINGTSVGTATVTASLGSSGVMRIGAGASAGAPYFGYINDMRVTRGIARYTQNFTPPTTAFLTL